MKLFNRAHMLLAICSNSVKEINPTRVFQCRLSQGQVSPEAKQTFKL